MKSFPAAPEGDFVVGMARGRHLWTSRIAGRPAVRPPAPAREAAPPAPAPAEAAPDPAPTASAPAPPLEGIAAAPALPASGSGSGLAALIGEAIRHALDAHLADVPAERRLRVASNVQYAVLARLAQDVHAGLGTAAPDFERPAAPDAAPGEYHSLFEEGAFGTSAPEAEVPADETEPHATPTLRRLEETWIEALRAAFDELGQRVEGEDARLVEEAIDLTIQAARQEREAIASEAAAPYAGRVENLRRRITKMRETVKRYRFLLKKVRSAKVVEGGVASIYRTVQGLAEEDPHGEKKKGMLIEVFRQNLRLFRRRRKAG